MGRGTLFMNHGYVCVNDAFRRILILGSRFVGEVQQQAERSYANYIADT